MPKVQMRQQSPKRNMILSPFHTAFKQLAEITEFIGGDINIRISDAPIPSPCSLPTVPSEPQQGTKQLPVPGRHGLKLGMI